MLNFLEQIPTEVVTSLVTTLLLFLLSLLFKTVRHTLLYTRHEFDFEYDSDFRGCDYDVQWENLRVTFKVGEVHNDHLQNVIVRINDIAPGYSFPDLRVSDAFEEIPRRNLHFKVNSIVRTKPQTGVREYQIYIVLRRRKWN